MTGIFRLIIMTVIAYFVYAFVRRLFQPLMGSATRRRRQTESTKTYSAKDGAIDAEYEELD